tara:strand:+ start:855 stop:1958 length:1104 start_codon:yes stop_codon:yes gene_type:complete
MSKHITYLYFDDTPRTADQVKENLESESLSIIVRREEPWKEIIAYLLDNEATFDGLILDWRLDASEDSSADFSSEALAQHCRRLQVDKVNGRGFNKSFPIILCSSQPGFNSIHQKDTTSEDLFDGVFEKNHLEDKEDFLLSLIESYEILAKKNVKVEEIISLSETEQLKIDNGLIRKINEIKEKQPHETVQFLNKEVINKNGVLIGEDVLLTRLGIKNDSEGWEFLKNELSIFRYKGVLSSVERWWSDLIEEWWSENFDGTTLKFLNAQERIQYLETKYENLKDSLNEQELSFGADSKEFWTVCRATGVPLAEMDGFIIDEHQHYSWQDKVYICLEEAKDETFRGESWNALLPYEEERLKSYFEDNV